MPLIIPDKLPAAGALKDENIFTMTGARAASQDIRPLKVIIVNLMPTKIATETQLARVLANSPLQIEMQLVGMDMHTSTHTSQDHLRSFYTTLEQFKEEYFDGMIITGSPIETLEFEEADYWPELCEIFEFAKTHVYSNMFICWGAQAALYYYYGIPKYVQKEKLFGVFEHRTLRPHNPLVRGFDELFYAPHSRYAITKKEDILKHPELRILAESEEAGPHIISTENGRQIFVLGHQEYDKTTLADEYFRDINKGLKTDVPANYFRNDDPQQEIMFRWRGHASLLFSNWLNYYLYQATPYNLRLCRTRNGNNHARSAHQSGESNRQRFFRDVLQIREPSVAHLLYTTFRVKTRVDFHLVRLKQIGNVRVIESHMPIFTDTGAGNIQGMFQEQTRIPRAFRVQIFRLPVHEKDILQRRQTGKQIFAHISRKGCIIVDSHAGIFIHVEGIHL